MRVHRLLLLVIPFLVCLPGRGLSEGNDAGPPNGNNPPIPEKATAACQTIAAILAAYPALEVRTSEGLVQDLRDRSEGFGCRVLSSGPTSGIAGEVDPADAIRGQLQGEGWKEDIQYAADGPGTTSFAFRKQRVLCMVSGGAHSWIEDGKIFTSERYKLDVGCVPDLEGTTPRR